MTLRETEMAADLINSAGTGPMGNALSDTLAQSEDHMSESVEMAKSGPSDPLASNPFAALCGTQEAQRDRGMVYWERTFGSCQRESP